MLKLIFLFVFILNFSAVFSDIISTDSNGNLIYDDEKVVLETELLDYYTTLEIDSQIDSLENQTENLENQTQSLWEELSDFFKYEDLLIYFYEKDEVYTRNETDLKINSLNETFENSTNELINTTQNLQDQIDVLDLNTFSGDYEELTNQPNLSIYTLNSDFIDLENNLENNYYDKPEIESQINVLDVELSDLRNMTETEYYTSDEVDEKVSNLESSITIDTNETLRVDELYDIVESLNNFSGDYDELDNAPELEKYDDALLDLEENYYTDDQVDKQINTLSDITQDLQTQINDIDLQSVNETSKIEDLDNKFTNEFNNLDTYDDTNLVNQINEVNTNSTNRDNNLQNEINSLNNFSGDYNNLTNQPNLSVYNQTDDINSLNLTIQESVFSENINRIYRGNDTLTTSNQFGSLRIELDFEKNFSSIPFLFLSFRDLISTNNTYSYSINSISQNNATIILSENFDNTFENNVLIDWIIVE